MAKQNNDPLGILKNKGNENNDPLGIKKKVETSQPSKTSAGKPSGSLQALTSGLEKSQASSGKAVNLLGQQTGVPVTQQVSPSTAPLKPTKEQVVPSQKESKVLMGGLDGFDPTSKLSTSTGIESPVDIAFQTGRVKPIDIAGIKGGTTQGIAKNKKYYETINLQKDLKSKGHQIEVTGIEDEKTKLASNLERDSLKLIEKEAFGEADFFKSVDNLLTKDKSFYSEEKLVPYLQDKFGKQGFEFEETGIGNQVTVSYVPDGQTETRNMTVDISEEGLANLSDFMKQTRMTQSEIDVVTGKTIIKPSDGKFGSDPESVEKYQNKMVELMALNPYKYGKNLIDEEYYTTIVNDRSLDLRVSAKQFKELSADLDKEINDYNNNPTEEGLIALNQKIASAKKIEKDLIEKSKRLDEIQKNYQKATGFYVAEKEKQGSFFGFIGGKLAKGFGSIEKNITNAAIDAIPVVLGTDATVDPVTKSKLDYLGYTDSEIKDYASKQMKRFFMPKLEEGLINVGSGGTTTKEYMESEDRSTFEKVIGMLSESIGAAAAGGGNPALTKLSFFAMSKNAIDEEMRGTDFDGLSENQKMLVSVPYALTIGYLENLGFKVSTGIGNNPLLNKITKSILAKTFSSLPKEASIELIEETIKKNTLATITDAGLKIVGGALVEGATEGVQQIDEVAIKNIANAITEKDYFKDVPDLTTTEGIKKTLGLALQDAKYGFYGGLIMAGGSTALNAVNKKFDEKKSNDEFAIFMDNMLDEKLLNVTFDNINTQFQKGEITREEAENQFKALDLAKQTIQSIPENLSLTDKRRSFDLINEKTKIEKSIEGKDKNLVQKETERINQINERLKAIGNEISQEETPTETTTEEKVPAEKTDVTDTNVGDIAKPTIETVEGAETSYTDKEGKFYSEKEVVEMPQEQLSQMTLQNPSETVLNTVETIFPTQQEVIKEQIEPIKEQGVSTEKVAETQATEVVNGETDVNKGENINRSYKVIELENGVKLIKTGNPEIDLDYQLTEKDLYDDNLLNSVLQNINNGIKFIEEEVNEKNNRGLIEKVSDKLFTPGSRKYEKKRAEELKNLKDAKSFFESYLSENDNSLKGKEIRINSEFDKKIDEVRNFYFENLYGTEPISDKEWFRLREERDAKIKELESERDSKLEELKPTPSVEQIDTQEKRVEKTTENVQTEEKPSAEKTTKTNEEVSKELNNVISDISTRVSEQNPDAKIMLNEKDGKINLNGLYVGEDKRSQGIGSKVLSDIKSEADKIGKVVTLKATDELGGDVEKLEAFYTKNGFEKVGENTFEYDPNKAMVEKPIENKFKKVADNIRKLKTTPPKFINPETGEEFEFTKQGFDWNDLVESVAVAVEKTGDVVGSVKEYLGKQDWYKNLSDDGKKAFENQVVENLPKEEVVSEQEKVSAEKPKKPTQPKTESSEEKERSFGKRVMESEVSDEIKSGISEDAKKYVPISNKVSVAEANYIIQGKGVQESVNMVLDFKNGLSPRVRITLGVELIKILDKEAIPSSYYQASQVADELSQFATELGQGIQVFSLWDKLSADGIIQSYVRKQDESKKRIKGKHSSTFEGAKEGYKSGTKSAGKKATQNVFGKSKSKASTVKAFGLDKTEIEKRKKAALEKLKKATTKGGGTLTSGGLNKEAIEAVVEYGAMVFADGIRNFKEWSAKIKEVAPDLSDDDLKSVWMNNESFGGKTFDELSKISEIEEVVADHFTKSSDVDSLSKKLQETFGLDKELADGLASEITDEFNRIVKSERQKEIDKKTPKLTKKVQQAIDEISEGENLTSKEIEEIIFKAFGIEKLTEEQSQKIRDLVDERYSRPEGFLRDEITRETLSYMATLNGIPKKDIFWSIYYASILSGYETQVLNVASNSLNIALESVVTSIEKALLSKGSLKERAGAIAEVYSGLLKGMKEGSRELSQILSTGHSARKISQKLEAKDTLENVNFKGGKLNPLNYYKYVGRFMFAVDSAAFLSANGSKKQELAREIAQSEGLHGKAMRDRVSEILNESEQSYSEAKEQATKEIEQIDNSAPKKMSERQKARLIKIRTSEIISEMIPDEIQEKANDYSSFVTYNYTPKGVLGTVSSTLSGLGETIPAFKFVVPFTRVVANVLNQQLDYTPYGYLRASGFNFGAGIKNRTTAENINERNRLLIKATIGTIGMVSLYALAKSYEDDDDPYFEISGKGPSDMNKKNQLYSQGWRPYSIKIGDKRISYQYTPLGVALSYVGNWLDNEKYKELEKKDFTTKSVFALQSSASGILDMSFLTGLSGFFEALSRDSDAEKTSESFQKTVGKIGTTFIPNLFKQLDKLYDPTIYDSKSIQASILKEIPIVKRYSDLKPKLNAFGQPVEKQGNRFYQNITKDPVWLFMAKNRIFAPSASPNTHTIYGKEMSDSEFYEYMEKSGKLAYDYFKDNLSEIQSELDVLEGKEKQNYIDELFQNFRDEVKQEIGSE